MNHMDLWLKTLEGNSGGTTTLQLGFCFSLQMNVLIGSGSG